MHILVLPSWYPTDWWPSNGVFFREQAQALRAAGYRVGVIAPLQMSLWELTRPRWPGGVGFEDDAGVPTYREENWAWLPRLPRASLHLWLASGRRLFRRYLREQGQPDVLHAHSILNAGVLGAELSQRYNIPLVVTEHSSAFAQEMILPWQERLVAQVTRRAQARVAVSPRLAELLNQRFDGDHFPWDCVPNLVDTDFFTPVPQPGRANPGQVFFTLGNLTEIKNQRSLIEAFARNFRGKDAVLWIGGEGEERARLMRQAQLEQVHNQVVFLGALGRAQVVEAMRQCDVFVLPSRYETFGVTVIEALSCGKPVVATRCGGPNEVVHDHNGLLVPPEDTAALGEALCRMAATLGRYDAEQIRAACIAKFGKGVVVKHLGMIYQRVLAEMEKAA